MKLFPQELIEHATFRKGEGCKECMEVGFTGRSALTEMFVVNEVMRNAILEKHPSRTLQEIAVQQGMQTLWDAGLRRAASGYTTLEEVTRVVAIDQF
jgi:type II secretory ATPase GspE/PulE/Tfp pilus assembly ATPase PilB-like protein